MEVREVHKSLVPRRTVAGLFLLCFLALVGACRSGSKGSQPQAEAPAPIPAPDLTIYMTADLQGYTEPCGCTSDPLGDIARASQLIAEAREKGPVLYFDGGSTLFSSPNPTERSMPQEKRKADLLANALTGPMSVDAVALGPHDLAEGPSGVRIPRQAINVKPEDGIELEAPKIFNQGGIRVGVFGVVSPMSVLGLGITTEDPVAPTTKTIADLRAQGCDVVIALAQMTKGEAYALAKAAPGMDFVLISQNLPEPKQVRPEPMHVGDTWLFYPANHGQMLTRLELKKRGKGPFADAIGPHRASLEIAALTTQVEQIRADLPGWEADPSADKAFVAEKKATIPKLEQQIAALGKSPYEIPESGNYFTLAHLRITKGLDCSKDLVAAKQAYDKAVGLANLEAAKDLPPPAPTAGKATYVGIEECEMCHSEAVEFWKGTPHAKAWETLASVEKQFNYDCIHCHVTGWEQPGGSNIAHNDDLRDVQCEQCHGPGSLHVEAESKEARIAAITRTPAQSVCGQCHTEEHSDTFAFDPYLRDVTGKGHGEEFRTKLGEGETAHELRSAALKKAGANIGENCPK